MKTEPVLSAPGAGLRKVVGTAGKRRVGWCLQLLCSQLEVILWQLLPWQPKMLSHVGRTLSSLFSLLVVNVNSLPTLDFSPLLRSKCWVVPPCVPDKKKTPEGLVPYTSKAVQCEAPVSQRLLKECPSH